MKALVTGFAPFDGDDSNPAQEALRLLPPRLGNLELTVRILPTAFGQALDALADALATTAPDIALGVGLAGALDESGRSGSRTRLLRFQPGVYTTAPFVHDYWEEVYLLQGDLTVGNDAAGRGGESFAPGTYACRPPGAVHGPFKSNRGCLLIEIHYYSD